jgi:hypothetical protein
VFLFSQLTRIGLPDPRTSGESNAASLEWVQAIEDARQTAIK